MHRAGRANATLPNRQVNQFCRLKESDLRLLEQAVESLRLSARAYHRILRMARTIADLAGATDIDTPHIMEATQYRRLDRAAGL
jgi:magnesium chelatase family protein